MKTSTIHLNDQRATTRLGGLLGSRAFPGSVICLDGDLGAGKTTLCQAIAQGLGVPHECYVSSPSFAIMHEYPGGRMPMYHMDFYRLHDSGEVIDLGFEEYIYGDGVTVIEWAARASDIMPADCLHIDIKANSTYSRQLIIQAGPSYFFLLAEILRSFA